MKIKFNSDDELPLNKTIEIPTMTIVVRAVFHENNKYYPQVFQTIVCIDYKNKSKDKLKEIDIKNRARYYFDDITKDVDIYFSDVLIDEKLYENISVYHISYRT